MSADRHQSRLERLRRYRVRREPDRSLHFMHDQFKREVARPFKQLEKLAALWAELVPAQLADHTRLESLSRGVLRVGVDSSARLYELDRLLRGGLQQDLIRRHSGPAVRRIQLRIFDF